MVNVAKNTRINKLSLQTFERIFTYVFILIKASKSIDLYEAIYLNWSQALSLGPLRNIIPKTNS